MSVVDPDVHAIYKHSMNRSKTNESVCTEANVWMQRNKNFVCVHCSRISEKGLSSLRHNSSILFYHTHISLSASLYYSVGSNSQTDRSKQFFSRKRKINTTGCIQIVYYQGPLFSPLKKIMSSSSMFHFSRPENRFNRFFFDHKYAVYFSFSRCDLCCWSLFLVTCDVPLPESQFSSDKFF